MTIVGNGKTLNDGKNMITNGHEIVNVFNEHDINVIEKSVTINLEI